MRIRAPVILGLLALTAWTRPLVAIGAAPTVGDIVFNEYASDNNASENDFFELLVLRDGLDLRGLRVSDNELVKGALNDGESVFVFGNEPYLAKVPRGTVIAVWTAAAGVTTDTVVNPAARDWKMVLAPGTGVQMTADHLGSKTNPGLSNDGDALYLYLPGPDGTSAGTDNIYLDFISWEKDEAAAPAGLTDLHLPSEADNAYYIGNSAAGNDVPGAWIRYDGAPNASTTPGEANPKQELGSLRGSKS